MWSWLSLSVSPVTAICACGGVLAGKSGSWVGEECRVRGRSGRRVGLVHDSEGRARHRDDGNRAVDGDDEPLDEVTQEGLPGDRLQLAAEHDEIDVELAGEPAERLRPRLPLAHDRFRLHAQPTGEVGRLVDHTFGEPGARLAAPTVLAAL